MYCAGGDSKRKGLPKWLREELEKMEKKRQKTLEKEAQELAMKEGEEKEHPTWKDEMDDSDEEEVALKDKWNNKNKTSRAYRVSSSGSPSDKVSARLFWLVKFYIV